MMKNKFTVEEINLMSVFDTDDRAKLIADIRQAMSYIQDSDMKELARQVLYKLEIMTDAEFVEVV